MKIEIACFNYESALVAANAGADRIELCAGFEVGGTTPDFGLLQKLKAEISIPIHVMIRGRGGDFVYSDAEFAQMKANLSKFQELADGFVFGILTPASKVDILRNSELVKQANKPCTFHRAFDEVNDFDGALKDVVSCGFSNILTSAGKGNAIDNFEKLRELAQKSEAKIEIMPGGGVRSSNIRKLKDSGARWFHSAAITDASQFADAKEITRLKMAGFLATDIENRLLSDFGSEAEAAVRLLSEAINAHDHLHSNRILRCIVFLSEGNLPKLRMAIDSAIADPRDVMLWTEYMESEGDTLRIRNFEEPFETA